MTDPREGEPGWVHPYMGPECGPDCHHDLKREPISSAAKEARDLLWTLEESSGAYPDTNEIVEAFAGRIRAEAMETALRAVTITCPRYGSHGDHGACGRCYDYQQAIRAAFAPPLTPKP